MPSHCGLTPSGWFTYIFCKSYFLMGYHFLFMLIFSGTQLGHKTRPWCYWKRRCLERKLSLKKIMKYCDHLKWQIYWTLSIILLLWQKPGLLETGSVFIINEYKTLPGLIRWVNRVSYMRSFFYHTSEK